MGPIMQLDSPSHKQNRASSYMSEGGDSDKENISDGHMTLYIAGLGRLLKWDDMGIIGQHFFM